MLIFYCQNEAQNHLNISNKSFEDMTEFKFLGMPETN
jgi:hypothetical protein